MAKTCPACGRPASGKFCSHCGASLETRRECANCGNVLPTGARFCNMCGTAVNTGTSTANASSIDRPAPLPAAVPWIISGVAVLVLVFVLLYPRLQPKPQTAASPPPPATAAPLDPSSIDVANMDPREAADRLFNRVMQNATVGDSATARSFIPMAVAAYDRVDPIDADVHYHLALLHMVNNDPASARGEADSILALDPGHLFGLFMAARAEQLAGNNNEALTFYQRLLDGYEEQIATGKVEYTEHGEVVQMRQEAQAFVDSN